MKRERTTGDVLKLIFVIVGAVVSIAALAAVVYTVFKKYFKVTFECDGECDDCDECGCFDDRDSDDCEPTYTEDEEEPAEDAE